MSGPTLSMAPAVESTHSLTFHRTHSSPDLFYLGSLPSQTATAQAFHRNTATSAQNASLRSQSSLSVATTPLSNSSINNNNTSTTSLPASGAATGANFKSLPSLPAFDVPLFDFDIDADFEFESLRPKKKKPAKSAVDPSHRVWAEFVREETRVAGSHSVGEGGACAGAGATSATKPEVGGVAAPAHAHAHAHTHTHNKEIGPSTPDCPKKEKAAVKSSAFTLSSSSSSSSSSFEKAKVEKVEIVGDSDKLSSRKRVLIDRPRTWLHNSRSSPNVRGLALRDQAKGAHQAQQPRAVRIVAAAAPASSSSLSSSSSPLSRATRNEVIGESIAPATAATAATGETGETGETGVTTTTSTTPVASEKMVERPRNVSASFVDFAKRSWISRSPSPSPLPTPKTPTTRKAPGSRDSSGKEKENGGLFGGKLSRIRPVPSVLFSADHRTSKDDSDARPRTANPVERDSRTSSSSGVSSNKASSANGGESALNTGRLTPDTVPRTPTTNNATSGVAVAVTAAAPAATTSNSSSSRALTRASEYLTRIKQRPQSMFVKFDASTSSPQIDQPSATSGSVSSDSISDKDNNSNDQTENDQTQKAQKDQIDQKDQIGQKDQNQTDTTSISTASDGDDSTIGATSSIYLPLHLPTDDEAPAVGRTSLQTSTSSGSSSDECSANDSTAQPASEAESLTTADTSHHSSSPMAPPTSRDPLWVAFKDLETNFFKFLSKTSTPQRIVLVRAALVPFLRRYALDSSNKNTNLLSPEDIERRASILNRWWTALLDMLDSPGQWQGEHGQLGHGSLLGSISSGSTYFPTSMTASGGVNGYGNSYGNNNSYNSSNSNGNGFVPLSGIDRPVVLEGLSMIMSRPEWRLLTNVFRPLIERSPGERVRARSNTNDSSPLEDSNMFVEESAEHNVRNMFVNNLLAQLVLVVDKMTMRHAPLSIVNFAGKVCAYAFYFVPGVADILVRLWGLDKNIELVRRAADAFGLPRRSRGESEDLIALFPPVIGSLGWSSVNTMHAKLRRAPKTGILGSSIVVACNRIPWYAPSWLARWRGAETDLFFIFCKYYHLLADEFMPSVLHLPLVEKARAPAYVLVHAQLLQILDNTIHRQAAVEAAMMANPMNGFSEGQQQQLSSDMDYASANASASDAFVPSMLLQPNHNLFREMDENRIIALLRDFLSADASLSGARDTFAESIMTLLKAAAFRTSQYDNNACYMLCDFLHELLLAFDEYNDSEYNGSGSAPIDFVDWTFWLDVCKMMLSSNNTMSEIRVLSFVFSAWDVVTADPARKEALCIQWLLSEDVFDKMFNNWCPMVRAYYMRLLCWRMCRDTGRPNDLDAKIFLLVSERLVKVWSHYLWLKQKADRAGQLPPSTVPSLPQPGKRFMIVRTEVNVPQLGLLANNHATNNVATTFDAMQIPFGGGAGSGADYSSTSSSSSEVKQATDGASARKKWSLLGKVLNFTGSASTSSKLSNDDQLEQMRRDTAASRSSNPLPPPRTARLGSPSSDSDSSTGSTPVFESTQYVFKFMLHNIPWQNFQGGPGGIMLPPAYRERIITRPRLPALAQARVSTRMNTNTNTNTNTNATHHRRSESPPPSAGLPAATRRVSGAATGGLIDGARNADPSETVPTVSPLESRRRSSSSSFGQSPIDGSRSSDVFVRDGSLSGSSDSEYELQIERPSIQPVEPKGHDALLRAKYAGRALAEWSLVVNECNSFVDRRRDEGVFGLGDIEVPSLGVESLRRLG